MLSDHLEGLVWVGRVCLRARRQLACHIGDYLLAHLHDLAHASREHTCKVGAINAHTQRQKRIKNMAGCATMVRWDQPQGATPTCTLSSACCEKARHGLGKRAPLLCTANSASTSGSPPSGNISRPNCSTKPLNGLCVATLTLCPYSLSFSATATKGCKTQPARVKCGH